MLVESADDILTRASRVNQARIHTGFHYPRSALTAARSMVLHQRFAADFPEAVVSEFQMLYAIARHGSKVSAKRFFRMFAGMQAPIAPANTMQSAMFDPATIEAAFACTEWAFAYTALRQSMAARIDAAGIDLKLGTRAEAIQEVSDGVVVQLSSGQEVKARYVFNVTYAGINALLRGAGLPMANLKYELTELALVEPPQQMAGYGITVMDGQFFSVMPYPSENLYSLTHVRYTPHQSWTDLDTVRAATDMRPQVEPESRHRHMMMDGRRYVPCLTEANWRKSLYEVKTVLVKNERDDGRPILYQRQPATSRVISILGGKIDNVYDLFDLVRRTGAEWSQAHEGFVLSDDRTMGAA